MAIEVAPLLYTTRAEIASISSDLGIDLKVDDDDSGTIEAPEEQLVTDAIWEATDTINEVCLHFYTAEVLETSAWVRRRASYLAAHILGRRRGNPSVYCDEVEKLLGKGGELERIRNGLLHIPRMAKRDDFTPKMSNVVVDMNHSQAKLRVLDGTSVGKASDAEQDKDYYGSGGFYW